MNQIELIKQHIKERLKLYDPDYVSAGKEFIALLSFIESLEKLEEPECQAYKDAKANNSAYIIEDGWIVRVFADGHKEKIKSLEKEQLKGLDEAAKQIAYDVCKDLYNGQEKDTIVYYAILAAIRMAKWMAEQGESLEVEVRSDCGGYPYIPAIELYDYYKDAPTAKVGDKVIVQIKKK